MVCRWFVDANSETFYVISLPMWISTFIHIWYDKWAPKKQSSKRYCNDSQCLWETWTCNYSKYTKVSETLTNKMPKLLIFGAKTNFFSLLTHKNNVQIICRFWTNRLRCGHFENGNIEHQKKCEYEPMKMIRIEQTSKDLASNTKLNNSMLILPLNFFFFFQTNICNSTYKMTANVAFYRINRNHNK